MTYKKIVMEMLRQDAKNWVEGLLKEKNIGYRWTDVTEPNIEKSDAEMLYDVKVTITMPDYKKIEIIVGGAVDDLIGISHSVIWDMNGKIVWMSVDKTRKDLGITEFRIA